MSVSVYSGLDAAESNGRLSESITRIPPFLPFLCVWACEIDGERFMSHWDIFESRGLIRLLGAAVCVDVLYFSYRSRRWRRLSLFLRTPAGCDEGQRVVVKLTDGGFRRRRCEAWGVNISWVLVLWTQTSYMNYEFVQTLCHHVGWSWMYSMV